VSFACGRRELLYDEESAAWFLLFVVDLGYDFNENEAHLLCLLLLTLAAISQ
jgi:hypothetical protein